MTSRPRSRRRGARKGPVGRQARVLALQCLYARDVRGREDPDLLDWLCREEPAGQSARRTAEAIVEGIAVNGEQLDTAIQGYAPALPVRLLSAVDRNILRVAIYELTHREQTPRNVVINEAVELAAMYGSESSARFVNGVLGAARNDLPAAGDGLPAVADSAGQPG